MKNRWIQNLIILLLFAAAIALVILLGVRQGSRPSTQNDVKITEKTEWTADGNSGSGTKDAEDITVYKTVNGKRYHLYSDCTSLSKSKTVIGLRKSAAESEGKTLCSYCEKRRDEE